jgi:subtilisin family serine protease
MKWLQLLLLTFIIFWGMRPYRDEFAALTNTNLPRTEWLVRFSASDFQAAFDWPADIEQLSTHAPIKSVVIQTRLNESELRKHLYSMKGVVRIEKGRYDSFNSPVYPTGMAILEPFNASALTYLKDSFHIQPLQTLEALGWWVVEIPDGLSFEALKQQCLASGYFKEVHRDEVVQGYSQQTNDPMFNNSWHIQQANDNDIDALEAWNLIPTNASTKSIAIIEGVGFDTLNADLSGRFIDRFNTTNNSTNVYANTTNEKHGTATSGIPCAIANNSISAAGLGYNKLKVQAIRIGYNVTASGNFTSTSLMQAAAINRAIAQSTTAAISMSISFTTFQTAMQNALNNARSQGRSNKGIPVFASSGNSGLSSWTNYPASYAGVIAVGATTSADARASFSNYGLGVTLAAPGNSIATTDITGTTGYSSGDNTFFSGTSAACPVAATVGALMIVLNNELTETQVKQILAQSCDKVGGYTYGSNSTHSLSTWSNELGYGRVNMNNALLLSSSSNSSLPDISLGSLSVSSSTPQANQSITITCNQQIAPSSGSSVSSTVEYRYSNDAIWSSDDLVIGSDISALGNSISTEAESIMFTIPSGSSGTKYILMKADALSSITESNEANNSATITLTIPGSSSLPDAIINSAVSSATNVNVGQVITISCVQSISSSGTTIYPSVQYRLSSDAVWQSTDTYIGSDVSTLNATTLNESENISYTIPNQIGARYILIKADAGNSIAESNENNNVAVIPITIIAAMSEPFDSQTLKSATSKADAQLSIFPNPAKSHVHIVSQEFEWNEVQIASIDGRIIRSEKRTGTNDTHTIDVSNLMKGIYYVLLTDGHSQIGQKLLVE